MSALSPLLQKFFTDRLVRQRHASPHTVASYRDTFRLLLQFVKAKTGKASAKLSLEDLDAPLIGAFLDHLESERGNGVRTRNARLTAIHSFFHFAELEVPEQAALIQRVLAVPDKRLDTALISYLERPEIEALLRSPDCSTWIGRRDHVLLLLAVQTGLRVSELAGLRCSDVQLGSGAHVRCDGKGERRGARR
jgi:integrase/recombinase XerD